MTHSSLVPEPTGSILDSIESVVGSEDAARKVMANPERAACTTGPTNRMPTGSMTTAPVGVVAAAGETRMRHRFLSRRLTTSAGPRHRM
jgi:hypothetical protein